MTSQLNVDTIVDKAGSGGSNVKMANTSTYVSDGGSATQNTVQGLCKMWFHIVTSDASIPDSLNVSSASDNGTGSFTQSNTNNMSNDDYAFAAMTGRKDNGSAETVAVSSRKTLTSGTRTHSFTDGGNANDSFALFGQVHGDLA